MPEIKSITKAIEVLEALRREKGPLSLAALHQQLGIPKSTLVRILYTLETAGLIERDAGLKNYYLGMKFLQYARSAAERITVKQVAAPVLKRIRDACLETVYIYILYKNRRICIDCLQGKSDVRVMVYLGQESPLYAGASGKVMLAYFTDEELERYLAETELQPLTDKTIVDREKLLQDLKLIRRRDYAVSRGEKVPGVISVSAPIWDENGRASASLSIAAPMEKQAEIENYVKLVKEGAEEISAYKVEIANLKAK